MMEEWNTGTWRESAERQLHGCCAQHVLHECLALERSKVSHGGYAVALGRFL
ncbi:MAG: hypothetical protein MSB11_11675 [Prevotella sp.]|nr:hypothetical protein [Prevotella sp.]